MRFWLIITACAFSALPSLAAPPTNAPACIELSDQFEHAHKLAFTNSHLTFLTIADRQGSEQLAAWIEPVARHFGTNLNVRGIADVSSVPGFLRGSVRSAFCKKQSYPVLLDWSGATVKKFAPHADQANVFLIDGRGVIVWRCAGAAQPAQLEELKTLIAAHLARRDTLKIAAKQ